MDKSAADEVLQKLSTIKKDAEREHNLLMARRFLRWWESLKHTQAILPPPRGSYNLGNLKFGVRLRPELCYKQDGKLHVTYIYATKIPKLTRHAAGEGLFMLRERLAIGPWLDATFQIIDLRQERLFQDEECISNRSAAYLAADLAFIDSVWPDDLPKAA